jgi:hypothetical protein
MPVFDVRCNNPSCGLVEEVSKAYEAEHPCSKCQSTTKTLMPYLRTGYKDQDPFAQVDGSMSLPDPKPIRSFASDKRKGGKDTT